MTKVKKTQADPQTRGELWRLIQAGFELLENELHKVNSGIRRIERKEKQMSAELDDLETKVTANGDVEKSAVVLLQGLKAALDAAGTDPAKLQALSASLGSQTDDLAAAIVANTPAAP